MVNIISVTAIAEMLNDGQYVTAAAIEYSDMVANEKLCIDMFSIIDRTITKVYANDHADRAKQGKDGLYVIIELSTRDKEARLIPTATPHSGPKPERPRPEGERPKMPAMVRKDPRVVVKQTKDIQTTSGEIITASDVAIFSDKTYQPVVEEFQQFMFKYLPYNLYIPKNYDNNKLYPLVLFIQDASPNGDDPLLTLAQGNGAVVWAMPEDQAKHECFVLAPQIPRHIRLTKDDFTVAPEFEILKELLDDIVDRYSIDKDRIYTTGQSQGCMASCELNVRYPDIFAASMLVAGQWNPETMAKKLAHHKMWILVSEGDAKAFPGMNAVTEALEKAGAKVGRYWWDGKSSAEEAAKAVEAALTEECNIRYTVFQDSSVVPSWKEHSDNHMSTWPVAYAIKGVRDWLLAQTKG
jgi:predicted peptidase